MKLGRKDARRDPRSLKLNRYLVAANLPPLPDASDYTTGIPSWPLLKNDAWGDCVPAGILHAIQLMTANTGTMHTPTDDEVTAAYEQLGNFNPADTSTDQGCVMLDAMNAWRNKGVAGHQLGAFAEVSLTDLDELRMAIHLFGCSPIGLNLPKSAEVQFDAGEPWQDVGKSPLLGGHCVLAAKYDQNYIYLVTWGKLWPATPAFLEKYLDEAFAPLSITDWASNSPSAIDLATLQTDLAAITV